VNKTHRYCGQLFSRSLLASAVAVDVGLGANEVQTLSLREVGIGGGRQDRETSRVRRMSGCTVRSTAHNRFSLPLTQSSAKRHVVSHKLTPLHVGQRQKRVGHIGVTENYQRNQASVGQRPSTLGQRNIQDAVSVNWRQKSAIPIDGGAPNWIFEIVACAVQRPVLGLDATLRCDRTKLPALHGLDDKVGLSDKMLRRQFWGERTFHIGGSSTFVLCACKNASAIKIFHLQVEIVSYRWFDDPTKLLGLTNAWFNEERCFVMGCQWLNVPKACTVSSAEISNRIFQFICLVMRK
jgi:hypothetical protein